MPSPLSSSTLRTLAAAAVGAVAGASLVAALGLRKSRCAQSAAAVQPNGYLPSLTPEEAQALPIFSTDYALPAGVSVRRATTADGDALFALMSAVAVGRGGLAREADEVDRAYTDDMLASALNGGIMMLAEYTDPSDPAAVPRVIAELKMARLGPHRSFRSSLTDTTMAVHPDFQGKKIGQHLFSRVFEHLTGTSEFAHIRRVELIARASNRGAHLMYEKVRTNRTRDDLQSHTGMKACFLMLTSLLSVHCPPLVSPRSASVCTRSSSSVS